MKITVPGFVTEENAQEAMKRLANKKRNRSRIVAGVATALGLSDNTWMRRRSRYAAGYRGTWGTWGNRAERTSSVINAGTMEVY